MTWFKVDDTFHSHPKAVAAGPAAVGLWTIAGSWSSANLTDGFVPDHMLPRLADDARALAETLVSVGLWRRAKGGYRFHDFGDYNPTADEVKADRNAARNRMRKLRAERRTTGQNANGSHELPRTSPERSRPVRNPDPTRPDPKGRGSVGESLSLPDAGAHKHDDDQDPVIQTIIGVLLDETSRRVTPQWADRVRRQILAGRNPDNPAAYIAACLRAAPRDYLPTGDEHPSSRSAREAIAEALGRSG